MKAHRVLCVAHRLRCRLFFFNDTATTEIYTLSLHDALPISALPPAVRVRQPDVFKGPGRLAVGASQVDRSEEHTSELQSRQYLVCRLLLEKKKSETAAPTRVAIMVLLTKRASTRAARLASSL